MTKRWTTVTGAILGVALLASAGTAVVAAREQGPGGFGRMRGGPGGMRGPGGPGGMLAGLRALELTDAQRTQVQATIAAHQQAANAQRNAVMTSRKALHEAVTAGTFDEAAVRQKAEDLAAIEADGAVLRAKVFSEIWALLTPEQQTKAKALQAQRASRVDQMRQRLAGRRGQRGERRARPQGE